MFQLIQEFPKQLLKALEIGEQSVFHTKLTGPIKNVIVSGLGGSGIGGNILSELLLNKLSVPVIVNNAYFLPTFADKSTLLILASYSGNTEETLSCAKQAVEKGLAPICITSGGKLAEFAAAHRLDLITIPSGFPPRACLGYSATQLFYVLLHFHLIDEEFKGWIKSTALLLQQEQHQMMQAADSLAEKLLKKIIILYAEDRYQSVAVRIKQQINENSKLHCWHNVIPELNHNELVGWRERNDALSVIFLRADDEYYRSSERLTFTKEVTQALSNHIYEVQAKGNNAFEKHFYLIHFGDWLSYYLAEKQGYDPSEIDVLIKLKAHMNALQ